MEAVAAGDAEGGVGHIAVGGPVGGDVDVREQEVLVVDGRGPVGDADHRHGQFE
jgi:hypothetical protein